MPRKRKTPAPHAVGCETPFRPAWTKTAVAAAAASAHAATNSAVESSTAGTYPVTRPAVRVCRGRGPPLPLRRCSRRCRGARDCLPPSPASDQGRWGRALEAGPGGWAAGDPPPREGNAVEILIDGAEALPRLAEAPESATSHVHLAGWHFSPEFELARNAKPLVLRNLLGELPSGSRSASSCGPAKPNNGEEDTRGALADLVAADAGVDRFLACTLYARHAAAPLGGAPGAVAGGARRRSDRGDRLALAAHRRGAARAPGTRRAAPAPPRPPPPRGPQVEPAPRPGERAARRRLGLDRMDAGERGE